MLLASMGIEIAGESVTQFVVRLLDGQDHGLHEAALIDGAAHDLSDGPIGLLASEPIIGTYRLDPPAHTAGEAAERATQVFAETVLRRQRESPIDPPPPPTTEERQELRSRYAAELPHRLRRAQDRLESTDWAERANAATMLGRYRVTEARPALQRLLDDPYPQVRESATAALERIPSKP